MPIIQEGFPSGNQADVEPNGGVRVVPLSRGYGRMFGGMTGTLAAGITAGGAVFVARFSLSSGSVKAHIERIRLVYTTITAFTTPVTAGRRLGIYRGSGAAASGGTAQASGPWRKDSLGAGGDSYFDDAQTGDVRYSTTAALGVGGITFETDALATMSLSHVGAAGGAYERTYEFPNGFCGPIILNAGELIAVRTIPTMDAVGTWQLAVDMEWHEAVLP